jgi:hypothetical protein
MAAMLRWMALTFARFVGLSVTILGAWILLVNLVEGARGPAWVYAWILGSGVVGAAGGLFYLFSFDGPAGFRHRWIRVLAWIGMLVSVMLPSSLTLMLVPLELLVSPSLFFSPAPVAAEAPVTSE